VAFILRRKKRPVPQKDRPHYFGNVFGFAITTDGVVNESPEFVHSASVGILASLASRVQFLGVGTNRVSETIVPR
jgi:hypothetical protein